MPSSKPVFSTPLTKLFNVNHPVLLAGMNVAAGPKLAAAVTNSGMRARGHRRNPAEPQVSSQLYRGDQVVPRGQGRAVWRGPAHPAAGRERAEDEQGLHLRSTVPELIDVIIEGKASLFVCAVGVPPKWAVDKLHAAGIVVMNMIGHPKHVAKALAQGVDIICAQGGEGGGHTGETPFSILIPAVVDLCKDAKSPLTGEPIVVVAAGGVADGRGLAAALAYGASGVWVGTRFVASEEAGANPLHKEMVLSAGYNDVARTVIYSGRPMNVRKTPYVEEWETKRRAEIETLVADGIIPHDAEVDKNPKAFKDGMGWLMGKVAGSINDIKPAKEIVDELVSTAARSLSAANDLKAKL
ncbi:unnamed protein product [Mycena citricolor]|uniref:2-nitropropane dioxygenase n=1 Tax=Mycena citricolor TaxID=2018698 RepID=A0AAD2HN12_9AGAR|nr:unnamed protein product [Mycena citricolor]